LDAMPQLERGHRERDLGEVAAEAPYAAGVDARRMAPDMVLLQHDDRGARARQVQRRRAAVQPAADDHDIGRGHQMRTTAFTAASSLGSAASSATVIGLTGG